MKANRLITIMLILQKRKKMRTQDLSQELGVSTRTIFRDLEELSANGFPIYCEHGPGGGVRIIEEYQGGVKTLTRDEIDALQIMRIPDPLTFLETGKTMQRAMLKLLSTLPEREEYSPNLYIDWNWWQQTGKVTEGRLEQVYDAVCQKTSLEVEFPLWNRMAFTQMIDPYGVVAKAGEWYLVYGVIGRCRMRRISELKIKRVTELRFEKPIGFNLESTWKRLCTEEESEYFSYRVSLRLLPEITQALMAPSWGIPYKIESIHEELDDSGRLEGILTYQNLIAARTHLLGWGNAVEVITPEPLRISLLDYAVQIKEIYNKSREGEKPSRPIHSY
jgi:predicted DNA-binding transcriptional regulator YafY